MNIPHTLFSFNGYIGRSEFWVGNLLLILFSTIYANQFIDPNATELSIAYLFFFFSSFWVSVAISVKRFRDLGRPWWWVFLLFVPFIGTAVWLVYLGFWQGR